MSCNCATNEQINELYRRYGEKQKKKRNFSLTFLLKKIALYICLIPIVPALFLFVFYKAFCDDNNIISIRKFFRFKNQNIETYVG
jgi:hypothetical protein